MEKGYVYGLKCPIENKCRYVGQTVQSLSKRLYKHLYEIDKYNSYKNAWLKKLRRLDLLIDIEIFIIEECDVNQLSEREIFWIKEYRTIGYSLTNTTEGGDCGSLGHKHSDEAKKKISEAGKRQKGKKRTNETKDKISKSLIGKVGRNTGNSHSEETKKQISETKQGILSWNATPVLQLTKDDEIIREWVSATAASKELKLSQGNIWSVINGNRNKCGGYKWKLK
jgi:group I intron endonuclease